MTSEKTENKGASPEDSSAKTTNSHFDNTENMHCQEVEQKQAKDAHDPLVADSGVHEHVRIQSLHALTFLT